MSQAGLRLWADTLQGDHQRAIKERWWCTPRPNPVAGALDGAKVTSLCHMEPRDAPLRPQALRLCCFGLLTWQGKARLSIGKGQAPTAEREGTAPVTITRKRRADAPQGTSTELQVALTNVLSWGSTMQCTAYSPSPKCCCTFSL